MNSDETILVIEADARAAIAIIRSFLRHGINVTAASDHRWCASFFISGLQKRVIYPSLDSSPDDFIEWLLGYLRTHSIKMLLPLGDTGVELIARYQREIRKYTLLFVPEYAPFISAYDKIQANKAAEAAGVPIPRCWYPDETGLDLVLNSASYPVLVKPAIGVGARNIIRVNSPGELKRAWTIDSKPNIRKFVQESIPQTARQYVVDVLMDTQFRAVAAVASEKVRFFPAGGGASTLSRSLNRPDLCKLAIKLLISMGYYGIGNVDLIEDPRDGVVKFLEINPRFGEMHAICNAVGVDLPYLLYCIARGDLLPTASDYPEGKYLRFFPTDLMWFINSPARFRAVPGFFESFRGKVKHTLFEENDYGPVLGYALENIALLANWKKFSYRFLR